MNKKKLKEKFFKEINKNNKFTAIYYILLSISTIICTLGLLINNSAVIIGAMLISPLYWPLIGSSVGILTTKKHILKRAIGLLISSIFICLIISILITKVSNISIINNEIDIRTHPNILDLFIAFFSGIVGIYAVYYPQISEKAIGVAISVALLPPICVTGIGLILGKSEIYQGSFLLFLTNIITIIFIGVIVLYFFGLHPKKKNNMRFKYGIILTFLIMLILAIPLLYYFKQNITQINSKTYINNIIKEEMYKISKHAKIDSISIDYNNNNEIIIESTVYMPHENNISKEKIREINKLISEKINKTSQIKLHLIDTVVIQ